MPAATRASGAVGSSTPASRDGSSSVDARSSTDIARAKRRAASGRRSSRCRIEFATPAGAPARRSSSGPRRSASVSSSCSRKGFPPVSSCHSSIAVSPSVPCTSCAVAPGLSGAGSRTVASRAIRSTTPLRSGSSVRHAATTTSRCRSIRRTRWSSHRRDGSSAQWRSSTTISSGRDSERRTASSNTAARTGAGSALGPSPGSSARSASAPVPAKSWSLAAADRPATSGSNSCRTTPYARSPSSSPPPARAKSGPPAAAPTPATSGSNSCRTTPYARSPSSSPPRAAATESSAPAASRAASSSRVLPMPAGPSTINAPLPRRRSPAIRESSCSRSRSSAGTRLPGLGGGGALAGFRRGRRFRRRRRRRCGAVPGTGLGAVRLLFGGLLGPDRCEQHRHVATVEVRPLLDHAELRHVLGQLHQEPLAALGVRRLAPAEHDRDLHAILVLQEALDARLLRLGLVRTGLRAELYLAGGGLLLVLAGRLRLLLLLVLVLRVVEHARDRRARVGRDLHQVEI